VSGEAFLSAEKVVENLWAVGAPPETPLGELTALPETTLADGEGVAAPPQEPHARSRPSSLRSCPNEKPWARPLIQITMLMGPAGIFKGFWLVNFSGVRYLISNKPFNFVADRDHGRGIVL